jgi:Tfp pilus assembly protein PilN
MIKVNLLQNTIEPTRLEVVESAITRRGTQQTLLVMLSLGACVFACLADYYITDRDNKRVKGEVAVEEQTAARLQEITKQANELQAKNKAVEDRINAILRLRAEQTGPLRVMQMVDARMPVDDKFRLRSVKQEGNGLVINGYAPSEATVTSFAKNLEFSQGLFTNFLVETRLVDNPESAKSGAPQPATEAKPEAKDEAKAAVKPAKAEAQKEKPATHVVEFAVKCGYNPQNLLTNAAATPAAPVPSPSQPGANQ